MTSEGTKKGDYLVVKGENIVLHGKPILLKGMVPKTPPLTPPWTSVLLTRQYLRRCRSGWMDEYGELYYRLSGT